MRRMMRRRIAVEIVSQRAPLPLKHISFGSNGSPDLQLHPRHFGDGTIGWRDGLDPGKLRWAATCL